MLIRMLCSVAHTKGFGYQGQVRNKGHVAQQTHIIYVMFAQDSTACVYILYNVYTVVMGHYPQCPVANI